VVDTENQTCQRSLAENRELFSWGRNYDLERLRQFCQASSAILRAYDLVVVGRVQTIRQVLMDEKLYSS
jgi:hypothetical protein